MPQEPLQTIKPTLDDFVDDDLLHGIFHDVGLDDPDPKRVEQFALELKIVWAKFAFSHGAETISITHNQARSSRHPEPKLQDNTVQTIQRSLPARDLRAFGKAALKIKKFINEQNYPLVKDALFAASFSLHFQNKYDLEKYIEVGTLFQKLDDGCRELHQLIDHLVKMRNEFSELSEEGRENWMIQAQSAGELQIRQNLYPYLQRSETIEGKNAAPFDIAQLGDKHDQNGWDYTVENSNTHVGYHPNPRHILLKSIAVLFTNLYDKPFNCVSRMGKPNYEIGMARYHGHGVRFAASIVHRLKLDRRFCDDDLSNKVSRIILINKIGDMWNDISKQSAPK